MFGHALRLVSSLVAFSCLYALCDVPRVQLLHSSAYLNTPGTVGQGKVDQTSHKIIIFKNSDILCSSYSSFSGQSCFHCCSEPGWLFQFPHASSLYSHTIILMMQAAHFCFALHITLAFQPFKLVRSKLVQISQRQCYH